jgi:hypothetical protein
MTRTLSLGLALSAFVLAQLATHPGLRAAELKVLSDQKFAGFGHPESVAYDPRGKVLYVGNFVELKPAEKDGKGKINKVSLDGKILEEGFLPAAGQTLNKPKGMWISGNRLWVADIDALWLFDLKTKQGKKLDLPLKFANDVALIGNALYVSDNRNDMLVRVEPADFLKAKTEPKITTVLSGKSINPNGLWPGKGGVLLMAGFKSKDELRGIYSMAPNAEPKPLGNHTGMLDGLYQMADGDVLATDWNLGALVRWNAKTGVQKIAEGIKGPADFAVIPNGKGLLVVQPDLVAGELRFLQLGK